VEVYSKCATIVGFVYNTNKPETFHHACKLHSHYKKEGYLEGKFVYLIANKFGSLSKTEFKAEEEYSVNNGIGLIKIDSSDSAGDLMPIFFEKLNIKENNSLCIVS